MYLCKTFINVCVRCVYTFTYVSEHLLCVGGRGGGNFHLHVWKHLQAI